MSKTIIVCGYGSGISNAVAEKFGAAGFSVALVARNADKLTAGVKALEGKGVKAAAFPADLGDAKAVKAMVGKVREALGPITVVHWNPYAGTAGDLLTADVAAIHNAFDVAVTGLIAAVQESLPDLKQDTKSAAILVTNGGFALPDPNVDAMVVKYNAMGLGLANAAKLKLVGMLAEKLRGDGIYVGQVMVLGTVKGTAFDQGQATLDPAAIADKFWEIYTARSPLSVNVS